MFTNGSLQTSAQYNRYQRNFSPESPPSFMPNSISSPADRQATLNKKLQYKRMLDDQIKDRLRYQQAANRLKTTQSKDYPSSSGSGGIIPMTHSFVSYNQNVTLQPSANRFEFRTSLNNPLNLPTMNEHRWTDQGKTSNEKWELDRIHRDLQSRLRSIRVPNVGTTTQSLLPNNSIRERHIMEQEDDGLGFSRYYSHKKDPRSRIRQSPSDLRIQSCLNQCDDLLKQAKANFLPAYKKRTKTQASPIVSAFNQSVPYRLPDLKREKANRKQSDQQVIVVNNPYVGSFKTKSDTNYKSMSSRPQKPGQLNPLTPLKPLPVKVAGSTYMTTPQANAGTSTLNRRDTDDQSVNEFLRAQKPKIGQQLIKQQQHTVMKANTTPLPTNTQNSNPPVGSQQYLSAEAATEDSQMTSLVQTRQTSPERTHPTKAIPSQTVQNSYQQIQKSQTSDIERKEQNQTKLLGVLIRAKARGFSLFNKIRSHRLRQNITSGTTSEMAKSQF